MEEALLFLLADTQEAVKMVAKDSEVLMEVPVGTVMEVVELKMEILVVHKNL